MADIAAIRQGIANNLAALPDVQVSAYMLSQPTPPACHVITGPTTFDFANARGVDELEMKVQLFVGLITDIGAQVLLDQYMAGSGALSIKQLVESDPTLGGAASEVSVTAATGLQQFSRADGVAVLMCEWTVMVLAHG